MSFLSTDMTDSVTFRKLAGLDQKTSKKKEQDRKEGQKRAAQGENTQPKKQPRTEKKGPPKAAWKEMQETLA
eukprot:9565018-Karenia_brevis.AAC.1